MGANPRPPALDTAPVNKLIWTFSLPAICSQVVSSMNNIVDQTFMGWGIGDLAIAAANVAFPVFTLITALACLIGIGCASGYSLFLGRRDEAGARKNLGNAVVLAVAVGLLMAVLGLVFLEAHALPLRGHRGHDALRPALYLRPPLGGALRHLCHGHGSCDPG